MYNTILQIRYQQGVRTLRDLGLLRILFLGGLLAVFSISFYNLVDLYSWWVVGAWAFSLVSIHNQRDDQQFLRHLGINRRMLFWMEYSILSAPFAFLFFIQGDLLHVLAVLASAAALAMINPIFPKLRLKRASRSIRWLPKAAFEWRSGWRNHGWILVLLLVLGLSMSNYVFVPLVALFGLALTTSAFYTDGESKEMLEAVANKPSTLLHRKAQIQLGLYSVMAAPLIAAFLLFHLHWWFVLLVVLAICVIFQLFALFLKYSMYEPGEPININLFTMWLGICTACLTLPFLQPVPLVMTVRMYHRAKANLQNYLYVNH